MVYEWSIWFEILSDLILYQKKDVTVPLPVDFFMGFLICAIGCFDFAWNFSSCSYLWIWILGDIPDGLHMEADKFPLN